MSVVLAPSRSELQDSWRSVLDHLGREMNPHTFQTWLSGTEPLRIEHSNIIIEARPGTSCDWLNQKLSCVVDRSVAAVLGEDMRARFVPAAPGLDAPSPQPAPAAVADATTGSGTPPQRTSSGVVGAINPHFTFERYLRTPGNEVALEGCLALTSGEPQLMSPVVLYGEPGLGKTHLLHALATRAVALGWPVACLGAEEFTNRYQSAIRANAVQALQQQLRSVRLLVIDDLQYLPGRTATIEEFVNSFDAVTNAGGAIACASERHPGELALPPRLISRLKGGILAQMSPLAPPDRRAYVNTRVREQRLSLPSWAIDRIAACEAPSVRVLQGAVSTVLMLQRTGKLVPAALDAHLVRFCATAASTASHLDQRGLIDAVAAHFAVAVDELTGRTRRRGVADARAVAMAALVERGQTLSQVSALFSNRDRSTVKEASDRGRKLLASDPALHRRLVG